MVVLAAAFIACGSPQQQRELVPTAPTALIPTQAPTAEPTNSPTASTIILELSVADVSSDIPDYDRGDWRHWTDEDSDCQDARQEVLIAESTVQVTYTDTDECRVESGRWIGPYTGTVVTDPGSLDVDHMVPLANAHKSGGWQWSKDRKREYANNLSYPGHLIATTARANRTKGAKGPEEWRPPNADYWCEYALDWISIKRTWGLIATEHEFAALSEMVQSCDINVFVQPVSARQQAEPTRTVTAQPDALTPSQTPTTQPAESDPAFEDRNCSDFSAWSDAQQFFEAAGGPTDDPHGLDRDGDGIACRSLPGAPGNSSPGAIPTAKPTVTPTPYPSATRTPATPTPTLSPTLAAPTAEQSSLKYDPAGPDRNCSDFSAWAEAQEFFEAAGGPTDDPHRLDRDGDGIACISLPGAPSNSSPTTISTARPAMTPTSNPTATVTPTPMPTTTVTPTPYPTTTVTPTPMPTTTVTPTPYPTTTVTPTPMPTTTVTLTPLLTVTVTPTPKFDDRNCSDFDTWAEAQDFFEDEGGPSDDPHRLDQDGDGIACQSLPGAPGSSSSTATPTVRPTVTQTRTVDDRNCSDFDTWQEAQDFFEDEGGPDQDPHRLDQDRDGVACKSLQASSGSSPPTAALTAEPTVVPTPTFDDRNCSDFDTWAEAQQFFEDEGGPQQDPHRLDQDGDGVACKSLQASLGSSSPTAKPTVTPTTTFDDRNCSDFDTWQEAQDFFEDEGGPQQDPHRLDQDGDGVACKSLQGSLGSSSPTAKPTVTPTTTFDDRNCSDFDTWQEAQDFFESAGGPDDDPHRLDRDGDGIACQSLPGAPGSSSPTATSIPDPTKTPTPKPLPPTSTPTPIPPSPTPTPQPEPTATPTPEPPSPTATPTPIPPSPTPTPTPRPEPTATFEDRNCSDFDTWSQAQEFFKSEGGPDKDPHRLDGDGNGIACQSLPGAP